MLEYIYNKLPRAIMHSTKTATLTFRIDPSLKEALRIAAQQKHRSIANMVEALIRDHCGRNGIEIAGTAAAVAARRGGKSKK